VGAEGQGTNTVNKNHKMVNKIEGGSLRMPLREEGPNKRGRKVPASRIVLAIDEM
jgi:hypothetical protein